MSKCLGHDLEDKKVLELSDERLSSIKAFRDSIQKDTDTLSINQNAYLATLTAGNHSFTEVTRC